MEKPGQDKKKKRRLGKWLRRISDNGQYYSFLGNYTLFTLILKKFTFMIITFKLFVIFAPNIQIRLDFSNHCNDIK